MITLNKKGFSLLEMITVVAIIGIVAAIAAPNFTQYLAQRRLNGAARQLYGDLSVARSQAISSNKWVSLKIVTTQQYTIFEDDNMNGNIDSGENSSPKDLRTDYYDVFFATSPGTIYAFKPTGNTGNGTLDITGSTGSKRITTSLAGRIKIN